MKLEVQSITIAIQPSSEARNAFQRLLDTIHLYGWLFINIITMISATGRQVKGLNSDTLNVVSLQLKISQPINKVSQVAKTGGTNV